MKLFLFRHGKSDKSQKEVLSHSEFELNRELVAGEAEKAQQVGTEIKKLVSDPSSVDLVFSGKIRSKQTVIALAEGMGIGAEQIAKSLREDFGLTYLATQDYWEACQKAVENAEVASYADYFLTHAPDSEFTYSADYMKKNMRAAIRRAIERNHFLKIETSVMVSHEPVISLCLSDLSGNSVSELEGSAEELEWAEFSVKVEHEKVVEIELGYRGQSYFVLSKIW